MLICGIMVIVAGFLVFGRSQLGRWIGILAASIVIIVNMTWVFAFSWAVGRDPARHARAVRAHRLRRPGDVDGLTHRDGGPARYPSLMRTTGLPSPPTRW
jgi:hypothetical protein